MKIKINERIFPKVQTCRILAALLCAALFITVMPLNAFAVEEPKTEGTHANLVLFAYFADETETDWFNETSETVDAGGMTNVQRYINYYNGSQNRSFSTYMSKISGGAYMVTNIFPQYDESTGKVTPLQLSVTETDARAKDCDAQIISELEKSINLSQWASQLDLDGDTVIDNISVVLQGEDGDVAGTTLRSHKFTTHAISSWSGTNLSAYTFNMLNTKALDGKRAGLIAHEYLHSLNYPDLYRKMQSDYPVGNWDIMSGDGRFMTYPLAYLRMAISGWAQIPDIVDAGTKTENSDGTTTYDLTLETISDTNLNNAVMITSPVNPYEKFVMEVREKPSDFYDGDSLDGGIPKSGVIVYRVDTTVESFSNFYGKTGVYVFGTGTGSTREDAALDAANSTYGSSDLNATGNVITYSNGTNTGIVVSEVSDIQDGKVTLKVTVPDWSALDPWVDSAGISGQYVTLVSPDETPMAVVQTAQWGSVRFHEYENGAWIDSALPDLEDRNGIADIKLISFNNKMFASYVDGSAVGHVKVLTDGVWVDVVNPSGNAVTGVSNNQMDIGVAGGRLYISYALDYNVLYIREVTVGDDAIQLGDATPVADTTDTGTFISAPRVLEQQGTLVIAYKDDNDIKLKKYDGSELAGAGDASSYDMITYNKELYFASASTSELTVKKYDAGNDAWTDFASGEIDSISPKLAVAQGNLYVVTGPATSGKTGVYAYEVTGGRLAKEGLDVDSGVNGGNYSMIASGDTLLIGYTNRDSGAAAVKEKTISNSLLSLTVTPPDKVSYMVGDEMSLSGLKVTANYQQNTRELAEGEYTVTGFGTAENGKLMARTPGEQTATVTMASDANITNTFTFLISEAPSSPSSSAIISVKNNGTESRDFVYGDRMDVTVDTAEMNGETLGLYYQKPDGSLTGLADTVVVGGDEVMFSYDTTKKLLPAGENLSVAVCLVEGDSKTVKDSVSVSLARKTLTASITGEVNKTYDGTTAAPQTAALRLDGVYNNEASLTGTIVYGSPDAKEQTLSVKDFKVNYGSGASDYYVSPAAPTAAGTIRKAAASQKAGSVTAGTLEAGKPLSSSTLSGSFTGVRGETLAGTLSWKNPNATFEAGTHTAAWVFTPSSSNYASLEGSVGITVVKKDVPVDPAPDDPAPDTSTPGGSAPDNSAPADPTPAAPASVSVNTSDSQSLKVFWKAVNGADGYELYRSASSGGGYSLTATVTSGKTEYRDTGLTIGSTYFYKVRAYRTVNGKKVYSGYSSEKSGTVKLSTVAGLRVQMTKYNTLQLNWDKAGDAKTYEVYYSTSPNSGYKRATSTKKTTYKFSKAKCGQTYYFKIRTYEKIGKVKYYSDYCAEVSGKTVLNGTPTVYVSKTKYNSVTIKWNKVASAKKYEIYYSTSPDGEYTLLKSQGGTSYTHKKLTTGVTYYYKVRPMRDYFYGEFSNVTSARPVLGELKNLKVKTGTNQLKISWKSSSGAEAYVLMRSESRDGDYVEISRSKKTSYTDKGLQDGKTYYYKVYAVAGVYQTNTLGPVGGTTKPPKLTAAVPLNRTMKEWFTRV